MCYNHPMKQTHNLKPIYNQDSRVLILGSFPSVISREHQFYYHNPQNRFWKIINNIFDENVQTIPDKTNLCLTHHIALWDVIESCEIKGSSDASISNVKVNDIASLLSQTSIDTIITNGSTAHKYYQKYLYPVLNLQDIPLPSTSSANARYKLEDLIKLYKPYIKE